MSKLKSLSRKLNSWRVNIAKQTQLKKHELAMTMVAERVKTDAEFAKDVLLIGGDDLREDIKKSANETIQKRKEYVDGLVKKWSSVLDNTTNISPAILIESQEKEILEEDLELIISHNTTLAYMKERGLHPMVPDGGCSLAEVSDKELLSALEHLSQEQTQRLKNGGLL